MQSVSENDESGIPFATPPNRFDQKNEMFKRSIWDEKMKPHGMIHDFSRLLVRKKLPHFNRFLMWVDDILGYDKAVAAESFWEAY